MGAWRVLTFQVNKQQTVKSGTRREFDGWDGGKIVQIRTECGFPLYVVVSEMLVGAEGPMYSTPFEDALRPPLPPHHVCVSQARLEGATSRI